MKTTVKQAAREAAVQNLVNFCKPTRVLTKSDKSKKAFPSDASEGDFQMAMRPRAFK